MDEKPRADFPGCYCMGAGPQISEMMRHFMPEGARDHFRQSRIEFLKGLRSLIDQRLEQMQKPETKGTNVSVE